jgi:CRISPR system Cascade subunit CasE
MTYLARIEIPAESAYAHGIMDSYGWHQRIWDCFPREPDRKRDFLTRIDTLEGAFRLWVLSPSQLSCPDWCPPENFAIREIAPSFLSHRYYAFDLRANPSKCLVQRDERGERKKNGKRVPLIQPDELRAWIGRKGQAGGFRIVADKPLEIGPMVKNHFRKREHAACHGGVQFRGVLEVIDPKQFTETYYAGVGSAKGFGFGLLLLAPVNLQTIHFTKRHKP